MKFFLVVAFLSAVSCQPAVPIFSWQSEPLAPVPHLKITFPDGSKDDFALLRPYNPVPLGPTERAEDVDACIYDGYLQDEKDVYVTLTGCANSDNFQIQFRSERLSGHMFKVTGGQAEQVHSIFGRFANNRNGSLAMITDASLKTPFKINKLLVPTGRALNSAGYLLRVKVRYDENFKAKFGDDSVNAVRRVMAHAQNIWMWKASLTTTVTFQIDPEVDAIPGKYVAGTDLKLVGAFSTDKVDANVVLAFRNNEPGTVGIAWGGSVCYPAEWRTSLNEYFVDDLTSGQTVAHEIGHNLGMMHDFDETPGKARFDSKGNPCSNIGGVMDYYGTVDKWSTCSVEDFSKLEAASTTFCLNTVGR